MYVRSYTILATKRGDPEDLLLNIINSSLSLGSPDCDFFISPHTTGRGGGLASVFKGILTVEP